MRRRSHRHPVRPGPAGAVERSPTSRRSGPEFQVNTYTTADQLTAASRRRRSTGIRGGLGQWIVLPERPRRIPKRDQPPGGSTLRAARRARSSSSTRTPPVRRTPPTWRSPRPATSWWRGKAVTIHFHQDGSSSGAFVQRFTAGGAPRAAEQPANTTTVGIPGGPGGRCRSGGRCGGGVGERILRLPPAMATASGVFAQRYDPAGTPVGPEFQVNTYTTAQQTGAGGRRRFCGGVRRRVAERLGLRLPHRPGWQWSGVFGQSLRSRRRAASAASSR